MFERLLKVELPQGQSAFLWGARKTGKSSYLKTYFPKSVYYDLLQSELYLAFSKEPHRFRQEVQALTSEERLRPIIIDEVQKIPALLDEVHWLIENASCQFILCGSSARKLKRTGVNLLGGRAWKFAFFPLVSKEIPQLDLLRALNTGLIPSHYLSTRPERSLKAYVEDYLKYEIQDEGLTRNLPAFARFLDAVGFTQGELVNYNNIARDCGVDAKTVKEYFYILVDTLLGYFIEPFSKHIKRDIITATPKFYLFDVGVANQLIKRKIPELKGAEAGKALEQLILMELMAYRGLSEKNFEIQYWRTKTGLEVDFILAERVVHVAIEVKISARIDKKEMSGLLAFLEEHPGVKAYCVCLEPRARMFGEIHVLPVQTFLQDLWEHRIT